MDSQRQKRKKHLDHLCYLTTGQLITAIEEKKLHQLRAILNAMDSCKSYNCWWVMFQVAKRYRQDVVDLIAAREENNLRRKKKSKVDTKINDT